MRGAQHLAGRADLILHFAPPSATADTHCSPTPVRGAERSRGGGADSAPAKQTAKQIRLRPILRIENTENPGISTHKFDFYNELPAQDTSAGAPIGGAIQAVVRFSALGHIRSIASRTSEPGRAAPRLVV